MTVSRRFKRSVKLASRKKVDVWEYEDQAESEFAFVMASFTGFDLPKIDAFLECEEIEAEVRDHLSEKREEAFHTYKHGDFNLAVSQFETLHTAVLFYEHRNSTELKDSGLRKGRAKGGKAAAAARAKLPPADELRRELDSLKANRGLTESEARSVIRRRYKNASSSAVSQKLNPKKKIAKHAKRA